MTSGSLTPSPSSSPLSPPSHHPSLPSPPHLLPSIPPLLPSSPLPSSFPLPSPLSQLTSIMDYNSLALLWECLAWRRQRAKNLIGERDWEKPFLLVTERACSYVVRVQSPHHSNGCYATIMRMQKKFETCVLTHQTLHPSNTLQVVFLSCIVFWPFSPANCSL